MVSPYLQRPLRSLEELKAICYEHEVERHLCAAFVAWYNDHKLKKDNCDEKQK